MQTECELANELESVIKPGNVIDAGRSREGADGPMALQRFVLPLDENDGGVCDLFVRCEEQMLEVAAACREDGRCGAGEE